MEREDNSQSHSQQQKRQGFQSFQTLHAIPPDEKISE
jgi:hypothetical protein